MIPGPGTVARVVVTDIGQGSLHSPGWRTPVEIREGKTTEAVIGGTGRPVTGQIVLDRKPDVPVDWTQNELVEIGLWDVKKGRRGKVYIRYVGNVDKTGRFCIPDVPAGDYRLTVPINNPPTPNACGAGAAIGRAEHKFSMPDIPGGRSDEPLDLGTITAGLFDTLDVGEIAPDFVAERLQGGALRLRDYQGKLVLLDFWATWCVPCLAEFPTVKEMHERFGDNPRFAIISLSCDNKASAPKRYVEEHDVPWAHVHVSGTQAKAPRDYTVRSLPATFLIAPDGRVLAKNLAGQELVRAVEAALKDDSLFTHSVSKLPPRFPVVRFSAVEVEAARSATPAVVVLDNTDPNFEKNQSHHDGLRAITSKGKVIWSHTGFNNCETVSGVHGVAIDPKRGRIYIRENVANRIVAFDLKGNKLWQIQRIEAGPLVVDPQTGNIWCSVGNRLNTGETVVFNTNGNEVAAYPYRAVDMVYDPHSDAFWLVGYQIIKLARNGDVLFREKVEGWCCASVSVNPRDGSVWIAERDHSDVVRSSNRLWLRNADGSVRRKIELGDSDIFVVECLPSTGDVLFSGYKKPLRRASVEGAVSELGDINVKNIAVSPSTGDIWVATQEAVLRIDTAGNVQAKWPFPSPSTQSWIAAF